MKDQDFHNKVDEMFESRLKRDRVRIMDIEKNRILTESDINYSLVLFDSDLNIYKLVNEQPVLVDNPNFKALLV